MFAEELSSNAVRKRQAEARNRRRQMKQKQKAKEKQEQQKQDRREKNSSSSTSVASSVANPETIASHAVEKEIDSFGNNLVDSTQTISAKTSKPLLSSSSESAIEAPSSPSKPASAVEIAAQKRRARTQIKLHNYLATTIQSTFRAYKSRETVLRQQRQSFDKKMSDLSTLLHILKSRVSVVDASKPLYVPPPATSTDLTIQFLFFANHKKLVKEDQQRLNLLIQYVLLPSIQTKDEQMEMLGVWVQSNVGKRRLEVVISVCLAYLSMIPYQDENDAKKNKVQNDDKHPLVFQFLLILFQSKGVVGEYINGIKYAENKIDLISRLRSVLFGKDESLLRTESQESIPRQEKYTMNLFFQLVLNVVLYDGRKNSNLYNIFFEKIFTIPLLTWKINTSSLLQIHEAQDTLSQPPFILFISRFIMKNRSALSKNENLSNLLPKVSLNKCPAPSLLCLLANLVQLGRACDVVNALNRSQFEWKAASEFFDLVSILLNQTPLGTFTHRAAVEWVHINSSDTPIILSSTVIEQCRLILMDSWVRALFYFALDDGILGTEQAISKKTEKDLKYEKEIMGSENAMSLAAKEATFQRGEGVLWNSSKWAKKLGRTMNDIFAISDNKKSSDQYQKGKGQLVNTSAISKQLANGKGKNTALNTQSFIPTAHKSQPRREKDTYSIMFFFALCRTYGTILSRWGGGGGADIIHLMGNSNNKKTQIASTQTEPCTLGLLNVLCFSTNIVRTTWGLLQGNEIILNGLKAFTNPDNSVSFIRALEIPSGFTPTSESQYQSIGPLVLFIFLSTLSHTLLITDDLEIHNDKPIPRHQLRRCIILLKEILYRACFVDINSKVAAQTKHSHFGLSLLYVSSKTMRDLYDRSSRRPLLIPKRWLVDDLLSKELGKCKSHQDYVSLLQSPILSICPYFVPFQRRLLLFNQIVTTSRVLVQGSNATHDLKPGKIVSISRSRVLEDGLLHLNNLGRNALRQRLVVTYQNEVGIDAGGLLKEFWCDLSALAFDPNFALFKTTSTEIGTYLYPNPSSSMAHGSDHITLFEFLGRILGKALYESITIQPQFSHFFLSFMRGDYNYMHMLSDLSTMDPVLYNNLMFLKTYEGDASDLTLSFTVANNDFGGNEEVALIRNGENIDVTNANKEKYISLMAKYHVCDRLRLQAEAFTRGLWDVIDPTWLRLFNEPELQVLISGSSSGKLDIADMKAHCKYVGGYTGLDRNISRFWKVVSGMSEKQQAALLKFVTSCERPPASGFKTMTPPFTIQRVWIRKDGDKLPSASTCFNILKLPTYSSEKVLKQRLIYSIESGAGFDLT